MKPNCYMDFDGTVNDNSDRLYQFMIDKLGDDISDILTKEEFWELKRYGINEVDWLNDKLNLSIDKEAYNLRKLEEIENETYLEYDKLISDSCNSFKLLSEKYNIHVITRRSNREGVLRQINKYGLNKFASSIQVIPQGNIKKSQIIRDNYNVDANDIIVGDTEDEIVTGLELEVQIYFVLSGIRSSWIVHKLEAADKVTIISNISDLLEI